MPDLHVIRHELRPHAFVNGEEYDPGSDKLTIVHKNPLDPDDPTEFGHTIRLQGLANRKEMWGLAEYADVIDMELKDLERYYFRREGVDYGPHPLAHITEHYFNGPPQRMRSFAPDYVMERVMQSAMPATKDGVMRMCIDVAISGIEDVKACLRNEKKKTFPCRGMSSLSSDSVTARSNTMDRMGEQTEQVNLVSSSGLDEVRQLLTDRASDMDATREKFVNTVLVESEVPEIMRRRVVASAAKRGML